MSAEANDTGLRRDNRRMYVKLAVVAGLMFGLSYGLTLVYKTICTALGINVLSLSELDESGTARTLDKNTQVDTSRTVSVEFDANSRGVWAFTPEKHSIQVHPGELATVMYDFTNIQQRTMAAQAIPSYAPMQAMPYFKKVECFCFREYTMKPGESKRWPVVFVIDPKLPKDIKTITLSYTFFEVPGKGNPDATAAQAPDAAPQEPRS